MKRGSLLLVDDDRPLLQSMAAWLRELGFTVDAVTSQADAIAAVGRKSYDLALVDIRLGDGDGFDVRWVDVACNVIGVEERPLIDERA